MKPLSLSAFLLTAWLVTPVSLYAQGDLNKPYQLNLVVHVAPNRLLTQVFRERMERDLHDGFQAGLGKLGHVHVMQKHPRLNEVLTRGLKSLDTWKDRSDEKTHFVLIDFADGYYEIQTRQYDGVTGRPSPVVRRDRTRDRDFVAKAAALLVKQDLGILGTVLAEADGPNQLVKVELRAGGLGSLANFVKKDDVFALAPPGGGSPAALAWSLLQVEEPPNEESSDGICLCRFFHRFNVPSILGYRCIKLGTISAPLRVRWVEKRANRRILLSVPISVEVRRYGFTGEDATRLQLNVNDGRLETVLDGDKGVFHNAAFVRVVGGGLPGNLPQVPVAIVDDQPILIEVNADKSASTLFTISRTTWQKAVVDSRLMQAALFKRLEQLGAKAEQREEVIQEAERGLKRSRSDREALTRQKTELLTEAKDLNQKLDTTREDKYLAELVEGEEVLDKFLNEQKNIDSTENDPLQRKWRTEIERAKLMEKDLELGNAIKVYEEIKKAGYQNPDLDKHLEDLRKRWTTVDAEHEDARNYIYRVWPTLDSTRLEDNIPKAKKALEKCDKVRDANSIRKLLKGTEAHADRLAKELGELHPELVSEDEAPALRLKKVGDKLIELGKEIQESLLKTTG